MENPASWNEAVKIIDEAIQEHRKDIKEGVCGLSLAQTIYNKLLTEYPELIKKYSHATVADAVAVRMLESVDEKTEKGKNTWEWRALDNERQITIYHRFAGEWAGSHFHKGEDPSKNPEYFLLISGILELESIDTLGNYCQIVLSARNGPIELIIQPNVLHRMKVVADCRFIEPRVTRFNPDKPDTFPASEFPIKTDW